MLNRKQQFGQFGEDLAARYLLRNGYEIICRNYRTRFGEIDIIARQGGAIVFIEVKSRRTAAFGHPKHAVTPDKQERISKAALYYLKMTDQPHIRARFDVVTILQSDQKTDVEIIRNAFELAYQ